ncbi:MAG TPA: hypothetical protein VMS65_08430, partial [Polyangiaceae bacterium]|nr:hypothetical protein [Polyangiaceae bacterium]
RFGLGVLGLLLVVVFARSGALGPYAALALGIASWALFLFGEGVERMLFFRASSAPKMPGAIGP